MHFSHVCIESLAFVLPDEVLTSAAIEERLGSVYEKLKLPFGRLELMTGIKERRVWPEKMRPSEGSAKAGKAVLAKSKLKAESIELFIHAAVCRDMLEPATASFAHASIGLPETAQIFDISNACLGFLNAMTMAAGMIESGQIKCAMIVSSENGRPLVEHTIKHLNESNLSRNEIKPFFANLTIGCGAVAAILCHDSLVEDSGHRLLGGVAKAATVHSALCQGDSEGSDGLAMQTDSEQLLVAGVELAYKTWLDFKHTQGWTETDVDRFIGHQVGAVHRRRVFETLGLDLAKDFSTFETLGNMGSASLPITLAYAEKSNAIKSGDRLALFGIGSGLNCMMLGVEW